MVPQRLSAISGSTEIIYLGYRWISGDPFRLCSSIKFKDFNKSNRHDLRDRLLGQLETWHASTLYFWREHPEALINFEATKFSKKRLVSEGPAEAKQNNSQHIDVDSLYSNKEIKCCRIGAHPFSVIIWFKPPTHLLQRPLF